MFIEELKNGKYRVGDRYKDPITGKWRKVSVTVPDKKRNTIKAAQQTLISKINAGMVYDTQKCTLRQLGDKYIADQKKTVTEQTARRNEYFVNEACKMLGEDALVDNLTSGYVREKLLEKKDTASGRNEFLKRFKAFIRWGYNNDYISDIRFIDKLNSFDDHEKKKRTREKYLEDEELKLLLSEMNVELWENLTLFLCLTGMRIGEAIALTASDIDLFSREIHVDKTWVITTDKLSNMTKTDAGIRDVYIQEQLLPLCKELRRVALINKMACGCDLIFQKDGKRILYRSYAKYIRNLGNNILGRDISPHIFRHTHVSMLASKGLSLEEIGRRIGHSEDSQVTKRVYFHVTQKLKERDNLRIKDVKII